MTQMTYKKDVSFRSLGGALRSTADLPWKVAESVFPTEKEEHVIRLRWSQRGLWGWPSAILSLENSLSVWFHRTLQPLLAAARRKTLQGEWCVGPWAPQLFSQPFPCHPALRPVLPPGPFHMTAGVHAQRHGVEVIQVPFAATVEKALALPGLGIVEVPDLPALAGTYWFRLQAEGRLRSCWNERDSGLVMKMVITTPYKSMTRTVCLQ